MLSSLRFASVLPVSDRIQQFAVHVHVAKRNIFHILDDVGFGHSIEVAPDKANILDGCVFESAQEQGILRLLHLQIAKLNVADNRSELAGLAFLVEKIYGKTRHSDLAYLNVSRIDVFQQATAHGIVLDADRAIQMWTIHMAAFRNNITHDPGDFATARPAPP